MPIIDWLGIAGGFLGLAGLIAAGMVVVRSKIATATIDLLSQNQEAQKSRIDTLVNENTVLRERVNALEHTKEELFEQVKSLPAFTEMATNIAQMNTILADQTQQIVRLVDQLALERRRQ